MRAIQWFVIAILGFLFSGCASIQTTATSETRQALALGISAAYNAPIPEAKYGIFRM